MMPPKKKHRSLPNPDAQPGIGRKYLIEKFSILPAIYEVKNGNILYVFISLGNCSRADTVRQLKQHYASYSIKSSLNVDIKRLVSQTLDKYKKLSDAREFEKFASICDEHFSIQEVDVCGQDIPSSTGTLIPDPAIPSTSGTSIPGPDFSSTCGPSQVDPVHDVPSTPEDILQTEPTSSTMTTTTRGRNELVTPRKAKMRKRLSFMSIKSSEMKKNIKELRKKVKTPKRVVNQAIQRKIDIIETRDKKIKELKRKLYSNDLSNELKKAKMELITLKNVHSKLVKAKGKIKRIPAETVPIAKHKHLQRQLKDKDQIINDFQHQNLLLQESVEELKSNQSESSKGDGKTYSSVTRLKAFDCISNNVPTASIPILLRQFEMRSGNDPQDVPQRSTVELMARELGAIAELQTAEMILATKDVTLGFDATTQEGTHINDVHFTTSKICLCAAVDELSGGTADDYANHICNSVDILAETYVYFNEGSSYQETRSSIINNISNSMTDRVAANHAALRLINSRWNKTLNELNCHLHPLDTIASSARSALKQLESSSGKVYGNDCIAANIILQMNKLRYKDGKGDPRGFVTFLDKKNLPRGLIPRYRGNRLHVLFHIAGVLIEHYDTFIELLKTGTSIGGFRSSLLHDFSSDEARVELQVLGLIGKHLTGVWMKKFYTSAEKEINHVDGIGVVSNVITSLKEMVKKPLNILSTTTDFFGADIIVTSRLTKLRSVPSNPLFSPMMTACLQATIVVLERQYSKYFALDITEKLREETASARSHNIDSEEIMGMFSAAQKKSPNATLCYLSCKMRACKNKTVAYIDNLSEERREEILRKAIKLGRKQREKRKKNMKDIRLELIKRQEQKQQNRDTAARRRLEKVLKNSGLDNARKDFPNLDYSKPEKLDDILEGRVVGKRICHVWSEDDGHVVYNGLIRKLYKTKKYKVAYWSQSEEVDDATDYNVSMFELAADLLHEDLVFAD